MNAYYSEDLRKKKIREAVGRGMPKIETARSFGVGISSAITRRLLFGRSSRACGVPSPFLKLTQTRRSLFLREPGRLEDVTG